MEAEQAVLGSILLSPRVFDEVADILTPLDFYRHAHGEIFRNMLELWDSREPIDLVTVTTKLQVKGNLEAVGGPVFLAALSEHVGFSAHAPHYARKVKDLSRLRRFIESCHTVLSRAYAPQDDVDAFIDEAEGIILGSVEKSSREALRPLSGILAEEVDRIEGLFHHEGLVGLTSGFMDLDAVTGGWQAGDLIILAARPSMGKTCLATNFALNSKVPVGIFSLEMSASQLGRRVISSELLIDGTRLRTGKLRTEEWLKLHDIEPKTSKPIYINDSATLSPTEIRAQARRLATKEKLGLIVVDYLQLMNAKAKSREQEVSLISRGLKALAKELHVPVVALSQLNRDVEKRTNKRPILSDLRDSGSLEQDADVIIFIYRDEMYRPESKDQGTAEIHIAKQRNGPTQRIKLAFMPQYFKFADLAQE